MAQRSVRAAEAQGQGFACVDENRARWSGVRLPEEPELRLIERLIQRDEQAFNKLVKAYEGRIFGLMLRMIGSRAEAEDLAQEVFVQVFKAIGSFRGESKLSTWIYRIAINLCKNRSKYLRVRHAGNEEELDSVNEQVGPTTAYRPTVADVARPDDMVEGKEVEHIVRRAIFELDPSFRECLVLRDIEDLSYDEIGAITGLPEGTVKSRIHRARGQLKEIVERDLGEKLS
jgi:RNA polymerase sigma-70 factor, ECF subfamily